MHCNKSSLSAAAPSELVAPSTRREQAGKVGMALLMWLLGVPGGIVLLYLIFAH